MPRILVVDDDPDILKLVVRRLQHANHRAQGAASASEACAFVAEKGAPDVVVLDVDMPNVDGLELLGRLREQIGNPELPAIFLSSRMRPDDIAAGRQLGAIYLTKPFMGTPLLSAIDGLIRARDEAQADDQEW